MHNTVLADHLGIGKHAKPCLHMGADRKTQNEISYRGVDGQMPTTTGLSIMVTKFKFEDIQRSPPGPRSCNCQCVFLLVRLQLHMV